jgi:NADH dehydrogenase/NADH oxidase (H2O2-forming)
MKNALKFNDMNLELVKFGIKVKNLETSNPDVLAGGDCVEKIHYVTKKPVPSSCTALLL